MIPGPATGHVARKIFLIATEESGDRLGAGLMKVLRQRLGGAVKFEGIGGQSMAREGLASLFPIEQLSIMCLPCCLSSRRNIAGCAARHAALSAIP